METPLVVHLIKLYKTTPDALEITPLTLPDAWDAEGNGIIAASAAVQAQMTLDGAKEINPQNAATDFRILPPMERKLGFSFDGQKFHAGVKLVTLPPRIDGTWVMSAQAHESWVSVSTHVNLSARQGSAPGISFRLPASTPEARITGDNVRETTSAVDGDWRVYQVAFQNDLADKTDFTVDFDLPGDGSVSLPPFEFVGVERADGFVIVDNASEYEMQVTPLRPRRGAERANPVSPLGVAQCQPLPRVARLELEPQDRPHPARKGGRALGARPLGGTEHGHSRRWERVAQGALSFEKPLPAIFPGEAPPMARSSRA